MNTSKKTMLAAALAVAVVALAGVGYAATQYTAQTENTSNGLDTTYLVISQSEAGRYGGNFLTAIYFDTVTTLDSTDPQAPVESVAYTPVATHKVSADGKYISLSGDETGTVSLISTKLTLSVTPTNNADNLVNLDVTTSGFDPNADLTYTMVLGTETKDATTNVVTITPVSNGVEVASGDAWHFQNLTMSTVDDAPTTWNVYLFISASAGVSSGDSGFAGTEGTGSYSTEFTFKVTASA